MQPVVQPTTRTPGPSTAEPVVKECMKPMSPCASAVRTSVSGTSLPRSTRRSNGLFASSGTCGAARVSAMMLAPSPTVERAVDDVHLLLAREPYEVHRVARDTDGEIRILLRVLHRIHQRLAIEHIHVHVKTRHAEVRIQDAGEVGDAVLFRAPETGGHQRHGER